MVLIQVKLTEQEDQKIAIYKIQNKLKTKAQAIQNIIQQYKEEKNK